MFVFFFHVIAGGKTDQISLHTCAHESGWRENRICLIFIIIYVPRYDEIVKKIHQTSNNLHIFVAEATPSRKFLKIQPTSIHNRQK